tara:strand:+ start:451 stop:867 length:417 start_codon:yes stop_codon:yes gene_type:complete
MIRLTQTPDDTPERTTSLIRGRVPVLVDVARIHHTNKTTALSSRVFCRTVRATTAPVVVIPDGEDFLVMDGNHRLALKARGYGHDSATRHMTAVAVLEPTDQPHLHGTLTGPLRRFAEGRISYDDLLTNTRNASEGTT